MLETNKGSPVRYQFRLLLIESISCQSTVQQKRFFFDNPVTFNTIALQMFR